jgi:hypothetical protein
MLPKKVVKVINIRGLVPHLAETQVLAWLEAVVAADDPLQLNLD